VFSGKNKGAIGEDDVVFGQTFFDGGKGGDD
jgi:hypothetical protein